MPDVKIETGRVIIYFPGGSSSKHQVSKRSPIDYFIEKNLLKKDIYTRQ